MPEFRSKIPQRIGVLLSCESLWEVVFSFYQIEKNNCMRMAIVYDSIKNDFKKKSIYEDISRIELVKTSEVKTGALKALIMTAGISEFKSLCNFEQAGESFSVDNNLRSFLKTIYRRGLPIGAFGYAVPLLVKSIQGITKTEPVVTVGNDPMLQVGIETSSAQAVSTRPTEVIIDQVNKLVTSGGQLASKRPLDAAADCENMFKAIMEFIKG
jgi:enhancing lycopene biosynthesis protein 2